MFNVIIGTVVFALISAAIRVEEICNDKALKECEDIDWNEYYNNMS